MEPAEKQRERRKARPIEIRPLQTQLRTFAHRETDLDQD